MKQWILLWDYFLPYFQNIPGLEISLNPNEKQQGDLIYQKIFHFPAKILSFFILKN